MDRQTDRWTDEGHVYNPLSALRQGIKNLTTGNKILWKRGQIAPEELLLLRSNFSSFHNTGLALTVKIRKSQDFLAPISGSPGDQIFSLTFRYSTSIFLNSHLRSKSPLLS